MRFSRISFLVTLAVVLAEGAAPAAVAPARPRVRTSIARSPNGLGWFNQPIRYSLTALAPAPSRTMVTCRPLSTVQFPNGLASGVAYQRVPLSRCRSSGVIGKTSASRISLSFTMPDGRAARGILSIRVDMEPPAVTADAPSAISPSPVHLQGTAADGFSGVRRIMLGFSEGFGVQPDMTADATCAGCTTTGPACDVRRRPMCGSAATWTFDGPAPPGLWSVTPLAFDLAGNQTRGDPVQILVL